MTMNKESAYILILLCIPLQFNILGDSIDLIIDDMQTDWIRKKELTYYEKYFTKKATP